MNPEPRYESDYTQRQVDAAHRVLIDICFCLEHYPAGMKPLAADWKARGTDPDVIKAIAILREKFSSVDSFGPQQVVEFHNASDLETRAMQARRAYELVQSFLKLAG